MTRGVRVGTQVNRRMERGDRSLRPVLQMAEDFPRRRCIAGPDFQIVVNRRCDVVDHSDVARLSAIGPMHRAGVVHSLSPIARRSRRTGLYRDSFERRTPVVPPVTPRGPTCGYGMVVLDGLNLRITRSVSWSARD